jgi:multidrug efflux pump
MTSLAFILGCVPLAIATGASANSRHSIGTGVIGGMLGATVIAVFFIPMFFYVLETMSERTSKKTPDSSGGASGDGPPPVTQPGPGAPAIKPSAPREDD